MTTAPIHQDLYFTVAHRVKRRRKKILRSSGGKIVLEQYAQDSITRELFHVSKEIEN